ncbi:SMI1/KNR4 family protein [Streptomyces sp. SID3343]|uniref:SMI1/KNR4 family protein n=1 Tax=Streptomyces sp. SID3343 TaxID=2690260 RepID=UPI0013694C58|nr:SMI1/KNR4 family protein [Streptomyces sp. SID3343]MYW00354.1 hypothetical protein [Streptomyces sp. SID3343]
MEDIYSITGISPATPTHHAAWQSFPAAVMECYPEDFREFMTTFGEGVLDSYLYFWLPDAAADWSTRFANDFSPEEIRALRSGTLPHRAAPWGSNDVGDSLWFVMAPEAKIPEIRAYIRGTGWVEFHCRFDEFLVKLCRDPRSLDLFSVPLPEPHWYHQSDKPQIVGALIEQLATNSWDTKISALRTCGFSALVGPESLWRWGEIEVREGIEQIEILYGEDPPPALRLRRDDLSDYILDYLDEHTNSADEVSALLTGLLGSPLFSENHEVPSVSSVAREAMWTGKTIRVSMTTLADEDHDDWKRTTVSITPKPRNSD